MNNLGVWNLVDDAVAVSLPEVRSNSQHPVFLFISQSVKKLVTRCFAPVFADFDDAAAIQVDHQGVSHTFEERIVLFLAMDGDDAIAKAEREAETYDGDSTGYFMSFELVDDSPFGSGHELFSLMRDSDLTTEQYLDRFHDSGTERSRTADSD